MAELVTELEEVIQNVIQFNHDLKSCKVLQKRLSNFRAWYYVASIKQFGPSKFIGFREMNCESYIAETAKKIVVNGRKRNENRGLETEHQIHDLFGDRLELVEEANENYFILVPMLEGLLKDHHKTLNCKSRLYLLK